MFETGNKVLANAGNLTMYGEKRPVRVNRLKQTANKGATSIFVDAGLDWRAGDVIVIAASDFDHQASEERTISAYNAATGEVTLKTALSYAHFGKSSSTANKYNGLDIRTEVLLMSSNVRVVATEEDDWGCLIVTSDYKEQNGKIRRGFTQIDNIEAVGCSQRDTLKTAIRFERTKTFGNSLTSSTFRNGKGKGFSIVASEQVTVDSNIFFNFVGYGGNIQESNKITLTNNVFVGIKERRSEPPESTVLSGNAGLIICAIDDVERDDDQTC